MVNRDKNVQESAWGGTEVE